MLTGEQQFESYIYVVFKLTKNPGSKGILPEYSVF